MGMPCDLELDRVTQMNLNAPGYEQLVDWLTAKVAGYLRLPSDAIAVDTPLADYGLDSAASLALCADLQDELGVVVETTIVWDHPTIDALAQHLADGGASS